MRDYSISKRKCCGIVLLLVCALFWGVWSVAIRRSVWLAAPASVPAATIGLDDADCDEVTLATDSLSPICEQRKAPVGPQGITIIAQGAPGIRFFIHHGSCVLGICWEISPAWSAVVPQAGYVAHRTLLSGSNEQIRAELKDGEHTLGRRTIYIRQATPSPLDGFIADWNAAKASPAARTEQERVWRRLASWAEQQQEPLASQARIRAARYHYMLLKQMWRDPILPAEQEESVRSELESTLALAKRYQWLGSAALLANRLSVVRRHSGALPSLEALEALYTLDGESHLRQAEPVHGWRAILLGERADADFVLGSAALWSQDLRTARRYLEGGLAAARALGDPAQIRKLSLAQLEYLLLSSPDLADEEARLESQIAVAQTACEQASLLGSLGWIRTLLQDMGVRESGSPVPLLDRAIELRMNPCPDRAALSNLWANRARAMSRLWEPSDNNDTSIAKAEQALQNMQRLDTGDEAESSIKMDRSLVEGRLAVLRRDPHTAVLRFQELFQLAEMKRAPVHRWLAHVYLGAAFEAAGQTTEALAAYESAENEQLRLQQQIPADLAHRVVNQRYTLAWTRHIELLLRLGRTDEALDVMRRRNQIQLGLSKRPWWPELPATHDADRQEQQGALSDYRLQRARFEEVLARGALQSTSTCMDVQKDKAAFLESLDRTLELSPPQGWPLPVYTSAELLIACHPRAGRWSCLGRNGEQGQTRELHIAHPLDAAAARAELVPWVLRQLRETGATRVHVLAQEPLVELDLAAELLRAEHQALIPVDYTIDRPEQSPRPRRPAALQNALVVLEPEGNLPAFDPSEALEMLGPVLRGLSVKVGSDELRAKQLRTAGWTSDVATSAFITGSLAEADVFLTVSHVDALPCPGSLTPFCRDILTRQVQADSRFSGLCLSRHTSLWAGDILASVRVPRLGLLLGCRSASRAVLAPDELLGLAEAMAIRGADVLAGARTMPLELAEQILCALRAGSHALADPAFDLALFTVQTQRHLSLGERCVAGQWRPAAPHDIAAERLDWGSLRVYVP